MKKYIMFICSHDPSIPPLPPTLVIEPNKDSLADTNDEDNEKPRYWIPVKKDSVPTRSPKICTHDLIGWSFQVACGMNYLKKRKVNANLCDSVFAFI